MTFTATYPRTAPLLSIKEDEGLREGTRYKVQKVIETMPKKLVAEEQAMIMEIVNAIQDILVDAAQAKADGLELPSLEEERVAHEAEAAKIAEQQREEEEKKKKLEELEEERMLGSLVQDELKRQRVRAKETKLRSRPPVLSEDSVENLSDNPLPHNILGFDQPINVVDSAGNSLLFQAVTGKFSIRRGPVSEVFTVRPVLPQGTGAGPLLALKQTDLDPAFNDRNMFKKHLQALETELETLKKIRHRNILDLFEYKLHKITDKNTDSGLSWTVSVLCEYAEKGSLEEFLDIAGSLNVTKVRSWTIDLLDALRFLHDQGIVHEDVHAGNVILVRAPGGEVMPKLADAGYQRKLHDLVGKKRAPNTLSVAKSAYWLPPETAHISEPRYSQKTDIWDFGVLFLQMIFGLTVIQKYSSPQTFAEAFDLSDSLNELVLKLFRPDPKKRPRAFELSSSEFLATDAPILDERTPETLPRFDSTVSLSPAVPRRQRRESTTSGQFSRYREDFVEEGRLGKGGFGEVVKARKKLDGQIYAIKKITQKSSASLTEVLKEVRLLSQLSHPSVVRKLHISFYLGITYIQLYYFVNGEWLLLLDRTLETFVINDSPPLPSERREERSTSMG